MQFQTRKNFSRSELEQYPKQNTIKHWKHDMETNGQDAGKKQEMKKNKKKTVNIMCRMHL